jgi:hypothetical protein
MEDTMCYARDYKIFDDQKKIEEARMAQERRAQAIDRLRNDAGKQGDVIRADPSPAKEVVPAK